MSFPLSRASSRWLIISLCRKSSTGIVISFRFRLSVDCTDRLTRSKGISYLPLNRLQALSVPSTFDGCGYAPHGGGSEPSLDQAYERRSRFGQRVGRTGEGEHFVEYRVVCTVPLHSESFLTPLHVSGQSPEGKPVTLQQRSFFLDHVSDPTGVERPQSEVVAENSYNGTFLDGSLGPAELGPSRLVHLPASDGFDSVQIRFQPCTQSSPVVVERVSRWCTVARGSHLGVGEGQGALVIEVALNLCIRRFSKQYHAHLTELGHWRSLTRRG